MKRDFTYIDDIITGVERIIDRIPTPEPGWSGDSPDPASNCAPYRLYNIGNSNPVELMQFIEALETAMGKKAEKQFLPLQPGDVPATYADVRDLVLDIGFRPGTPIAEDLSRFLPWYRSYYNILDVKVIHILVFAIR